MKVRMPQEIFQPAQKTSKINGGIHRPNTHYGLNETKLPVKESIRQ
jgi:hypothetical protein